MKRASFVIGCVLLVLATVVAFAQQRGSDLPAGVPTARWIPLNEQAGGVLAEAPSRGAVEGDLMVKVKGQWVRVYPSPLPLKATPLQVR